MVAWPTVEEARDLAARHRDEIEDFREHEQRAEALAALKKVQAARRTGLEKQQGVLRQRQQKQRHSLVKEQKAGRDQHRAAYLAETRHIRKERYERRPQGLAAFLGRVSGVALVRKKLHQYQDRKRYQTFLKEKEQLKERQERQHAELQRRHELQALDLARKVRALDQIDRRELRSLEQSLFADQRIQARGGCEHMPALPLAQDGDRGKAARKDIDLTRVFDRAAQDDSDRTGESSEGQSPAKRSKVNQYRRQKAKQRDRDDDRGR